MKTFISAIMAGMMIAIGALVYLQLQGIAGAVFFAIGLLAIVELNFHLFTGKVSYLFQNNNLPSIIHILLGNAIGCCIMFFFPREAATSIVIGKIETSLLITFIEAALCNMLIYIAVESFKNGNVIALIFAVATFILAGLEHSIASMCFIVSARMFTWSALIYLIVAILGNAVGGLLIHNVRMKVKQ
jgi:formate/nitrite transporter FocA (FNT family)